MKRLTIALTLLVLLAGAFTAWVATRPTPTYNEPTADKDGTYVVGSLPEDGEGPVRACADGLATALSYDHRSLDDDLDRAAALMTDDFATRFRDTFKRTTGADARAKKIVTRAIVRGAGLVTSDDDKAECLAFLDQILVRSTGIDQGVDPMKISQNRVTVILSEQDDRWLVDDIRPF